MRAEKIGRQAVSLLLCLGMVMTVIFSSGAGGTVYARTKASGSNLSRTKKASDSNLRRRQRQSETRSAVPAALAQEETEDVGLSIYQNFGEITGEEFTFSYTTVNHQEREITVAKNSSYGVNVLTRTFQFERDGESYKGFKVIGFRIELPTDYEDEDDDEDENEGYEEYLESGQDTQYYYANSIGEGEYCAEMLMELTGDELFTGELYYTEEDTDPETAEWESYEDASLSGQRYNVKLWQTQGCFAAKVKPGEEKKENGKALIITLSGDATLGETPDEDGDALKSALIRTEQFSAADITVLHVPSGSSEDYKSRIWDWIDAAAEEEGLTLIAYSGHGNFLDDGSAQLSMGSNSISAYELKQHVSKLKGKLVMLIDSCFSGGMIMPTTLELDETEMEAGADDTLKYYIYAAGSAYETTIQGMAGGQLLRSFGYALGYDRYRGSYHVFAADTDGDGSITAGELGSYIQNSGSYSVPTVYPADSEDVLFSYSEEMGTPAVFSAVGTDSSDVCLNEDGSVDVSVAVTNYSDAEISFDALAARASVVDICMPGSYEDCLKRTDDIKLIYEKDVNKHSVPAHETEEFTLHFKSSYFQNRGRFLIRLWGTEDTSAENFAITDFWVSGSSSETESDAIDKTAFQIQKPGSIRTAENAPEVSSILPVTVRFDREPTNKTGYAACTLTARALDLGESADYTADAQGEILDNQGQPLDTTEESGWITLYEDLRPQYVREERYTADEHQAAYYSYMWDVTGLTRGHYYALQILCHYDDGTEAKRTSFIRSVSQAEAAEAPYVIGEHYIEMSYFPQSYNGGIRLGEGWENAGEDSTVKKAGENFLQLLNRNNYQYDGSSTEKNMHYSITGEDGDTGWYQVGADGKLTAMQADDHFEQGSSYVTRITMSIDQNWNAVFAEGADFRVGGHSLYDNSPYRTEDNVGEAIPYTSGTDAENPKQAVIYVLHENVGVPEDALKVCRAGSKTALTAEETLCVGDEIDVYVPDGYSITVSKSTAGLEKVKSSSAYTRYRVLGNIPRIKIRMYRPSDDNVEQSCRCASVLYSHEVTDAKGAVISITAPEQRFYSCSDQGKLSLSGGKISYYTSKYKKTTRSLEKFISIYPDSLYTYDAEQESYQPWEDAQLNAPGSYTLYVLYKGRYYEGFTIEVGYAPGDDFVVDAAFDESTDAAELVLSLSVQTEAEDTEKGSIRVRHEVKRKEGNKFTTLSLVSGSISYLIPYPEGLDSEDAYTIREGKANVPVQLEKRAEGLWITAERSGSFSIRYQKKADAQPDPIPEPEPAPVPEPEPQPDAGADTTDTDTAGKDQQGNEGGAADIQPSDTNQSSDTQPAEAKPSNTRPYSVGRGRSSGGGVRILGKGLYGTGWKQVSSNGQDSWYYFGDDGRMYTGWLLNGGKWYYLQPDGRMATGWLHLGKDWYYLEDSGAMVNAAKEIDGKSQFFLPDGRWIAS